MNNIEKIISGAAVSFAVIILGAGSFGVAHAATDCTPSAADLAGIAATQSDPTLTYSQEVTQELALRKQLVSATIACAQSDAQSLKAQLTNATVPDEVTPLQSQLASALDDAANFYTIELTKLNGAGIAGTKAVAREVLDWRKGTYAALSGEVNNFILWAGNQTLFSTAAVRMDQTRRAVSFLESAAPDNDLQSAMNATSQSFDAAEGKNDAAKSALMQSLPPTQSLNLIKQSLDSLSTTYQNFSTVSTMIKKILPQ